MQSKLHRIALGVALIAASLALPACSGGGAAAATRDPLLRAAEDGLPASQRKEAVEQAYIQYEAGDLSEILFIKSMKSLAWKFSAPSEVRNAAIDNLAAVNPEDTANMCRLIIQSETNWEVLTHICNLIAENDWTSATSGLVRSWSRPVSDPPDDQRPERKAIVALYPDTPVEQVIFEVFATPIDDDPLFGEKTRRDAWALLMRIDPEGHNVQALLAEDQSDTDDQLLVNLKAVATDFRCIPLNAEQLTWVERMREPQHAQFWAEATDAIANLKPWQQQNLQLRHAAVIRWFAINMPEYLELSKGELVSKVELRLEHRKHYPRTAGFSDPDAGLMDRVSFWQDRMIWADLLAVLLADFATQEPAVIQNMFAQAHADFLDKTTEYGGVLQCWNLGEKSPPYDAESYEPRPTQRFGDNRFVASTELLEASACAPFHYHFHAQRYTNRDYAGPGPGDLDYAKRYGRFCIVLTYINRNTLNVDFYDPIAIRIDIGDIETGD